MATVFTIGHSVRPAAETVAMLTESGVTRLIDVRRRPFSRRNPQYNRDAFAAALAEAGIAYEHAETLGGMRDAPADGSRNPGWTQAAFRNYADYALGAAFRDALSALRTRAAAETVAVMCAEADWRACHRQILADYLIAAGDTVVHLTAPGARAPARLTAFARIEADGVVYRRPDPAQGALTL